MENANESDEQYISVFIESLTKGLDKIGLEEIASSIRESCEGIKDARSRLTEVLKTLSGAFMHPYVFADSIFKIITELKGKEGMKVVKIEDIEFVDEGELGGKWSLKDLKKSFSVCHQSAKLLIDRVSELFELGAPRY